MLDVVYLLVLAVFAALTAGLIALCERVKGSNP